MKQFHIAILLAFILPLSACHSQSDKQHQVSKEIEMSKASSTQEVTKTSSNTMYSKLLNFALTRPQVGPDTDTAVGKIVNEYIQEGMPLAEVQKIFAKNNFPLTKAHPSHAQSRQGLEVYVGSVDHIKIPNHPFLYAEVRVVLKVREQNIVGIGTHYFIQGTFD